MRWMWKVEGEEEMGHLLSRKEKLWEEGSGSAGLSALGLALRSSFYPGGFARARRRSGDKVNVPRKVS